MRITIVDDNDEFRRTFEQLLEHKFGHEIVGSFKNGEEFSKYFQSALTDIVLMDISLPDTDGYTLVKQTIWHTPNLKAIAITMFNDKAYLRKLIEVGFKGFVYKSNIYPEIEKAIQQVHKGSYYFPEEVSIEN